MGRVMDMILNVMSLLLVGAGLTLTATFFVGSPFTDPAPAETAAVDRDEPNVPTITGGSEEKASRKPVGNNKQEKRAIANVPKDKTLRITIPSMRRITNDTVPYAGGHDENAFRNHAGVHLRGTGFPWQRQANVYIAGHRLGYVGTPSFLAFWDLNKVDAGDKIFVTDSSGRRYVYRVFKDFVVDPKDVFVTRPLRGKNILTLQTCTLPSYSRRLIVQAEKVS
jgi:sortase A